MKIRATTNQLGLAPMRIPKTLASWIDPVPIQTHGGRRAQADAPTAESLAMRLPSPRRRPRLGNVRLSVKLGLSFGAILALTAAIIAVDVRNVEGLEEAHDRVTRDVVPRILAAQKAQAAFADLHFAQTSMVLTRGQQREDEMDDLAVARQAVAGHADAAADNVVAAIERYITQAHMDRAAADEDFATLESATTRTSMVL